MRLFEAGNYDVIVVGAGHAGCEAALISAKMGMKVLLLTLSLDSVAHLACNPSIGGTGKSQLVREVDALGGYMAINTDKTFILSRMLNSSKGASVQSLRVQVDKIKYQNSMKEHIESIENIDLIMDEAIELIRDGDKITGVITRLGAKYNAKAVILATGVYLDSKIYIGEVNFKSGPLGLQGAYELSKSLKDLNLPLRKFKTGTPARVHKYSIDFSNMEEQKGDEIIIPFSFVNEGENIGENLVSCYLTRTNEKTHEIIRNNMDRSAMARGDMDAIAGARYCPSIEDKVVRFADKESHQFFIEPEGVNTMEYYIQGFSTSLAYEVQQEMYHTVAGLENVKMTRPAYAIEYDCIDPQILTQTLKVIGLEGLYMAGQINSTSGYEEAAAQGIIAGINASAEIKGIEPLIITRDEGYIGVLIDDITTKGTDEPYRMMTSRAEYRLMLGEDSADKRMMKYAIKYNTTSEKRKKIMEEKYKTIDEQIKFLKKTKPEIEEVNKIFRQLDEDEITEKKSLYELMKRPRLNYKILEENDIIENQDIAYETKKKVESQIKYEGYIKKSQSQIENFRKNENKKLSENLNYNSIDGLRLEARQKLDKIKPSSIGQASRIPGVSPADISVILIYLKSMGQN